MENCQSKSIGFDIKQLAILIGRAFDTKLLNDGQFQNENGCNLTIMQSHIIGFIYFHKNHTVTQKDLETEFARRRSTITGILKLMEKNGLITREYSKKDARIKLVTLTNKAILLHKNIMTKLDEFNKNLEQGLTQQEIDTFRSIIEKIKQNLE